MNSFKLALTGWMVAALTSPALAQQQQQGGEPYGPPYGYGHMMWYGNGPWGWGGMHPGFFFGPLMMLLVVLGVVFCVMMLGRVFRHAGHGMGMCGHGGHGGRSTALDILAERFAKGEIDKKEFDEKRKLIGG